MNTTEEIVPTSQEAAVQLTKQSKKALVKNINADWKKVEDLAKTAGKAEVSAANIMRGIGIKLRELVGHEQLTLTGFQSFQADLPKKLTFKSAKLCVKLSEVYGDQITSIDQVRPIQKELREIVCETPVEKQIRGPQQAHERNSWSEWVSNIAKSATIFDEIEQEQPMANWEKDKLKSFVKYGKPLADKVHAAEARLEEMS